MKTTCTSRASFAIASLYQWLLLIIFLAAAPAHAWHTPPEAGGSRSGAAFAGEEIVSFSLVNADTRQVIQTITPGSTLNLTVLPRNLNVRANPGAVAVESVVFRLSGTLIRNQTESLAPFELFGDGAWTPVTGSYTLTATPYSAAAGGGTAGTARTISFSFTRALPLQVNFQDPATVPPAGWVSDYGQPYGLRTAANQGSNLTYGWRKRSDGTPLDLSVGGTTPGNGRNRAVTDDILLNTLMHMQADDVEGNFNGTQAEGYWEARVPNGIYDVTVTVGDIGVFPMFERHCLNVEGLKAITDFEPTGAAGTATRTKTAQVRVTVADGNVTLNADGGVNTKITSVRVVPVASGPYAYWSANAHDQQVEKGSTTGSTFSVELTNSLNRQSLQYTLSAEYSSAASGWLAFNPTHAGTEPNVTFNYAAARSLPVGTYSATVTATAPGFAGGKIVVTVAVEAPHPYVIASSPTQGATNVSINTTSVAANSLYVPEVDGFKGGVDNTTINSSTVKLMKMGPTPTQVLGVVQGTGGGDAISFSPSFALEANTTYKFMVTSGVKTYSGTGFIPYEATFTTGSAVAPTDPLNVEFTKVSIPGTQNKKYTSLSIGPDGKLYALKLDGGLERYTINRTDGTLSGQQLINTISTKYGARYAVGLAFDPAATATNPIVYISHSSGWDNAPMFDGKISRLSGASLATEQLLINNLPRSVRDHLVNSLAFGPDGALYFTQGSNSSMGSQDAVWQRPECLLSATVLRLDLKKLATVPLPLDVRTTDNQQVVNSAPATSMRMSDGTYNPYGSTSPLTIYASGVRNGYDLVWHTNGQLYVPSNGSAAGGNSPASVAGTRRPTGAFYNGPYVPATAAVPVQNDLLYRINPLKHVGYFGHPNPMRGEYVTYRGFADNPNYPVTQGADANFRGAIYNFETNRSPNGALEYKSSAFGGVLKGRLLVCRFSGGGDVIALKPGALVKDPAVNTADSDDRIYNIVQAHAGAGTTGMVGLSGFLNPLDIVEDVQTGNLYVSEYNWNNNPVSPSQITLLRVAPLSADDGYASAFPSSISAAEMVGDPTVTQYSVTIANTGRGNLNVKDIQIVGDDAQEFQLIGAPEVSLKKLLKIAKNSAVTFNVAFKPSTKGHKKAQLLVKSQKKDKKDQEVTVELNGLGMVYEESVDAAASAADAARKESNAAQVAVEARGLTVYPNPNAAGSKVYVKLQHFGKGEPVTLSLLDSKGQLVQARTVVTNGQGAADAELPLAPSLNRGMYIIQAQGQSANKRAKLIVE